MTPVRLGYLTGAALAASMGAWFVGAGHVAVMQDHSLVPVASDGLEALLVTQAGLVVLLSPLLAAGGEIRPALAAVSAPVVVPLPLVWLLWTAGEAPVAPVVSFQCILLVAGLTLCGLLVHPLGMIREGLRGPTAASVALSALAGLWLARGLWNPGLGG